MNGRAPQVVWTWKGIALAMGTTPRTVKAWKARGAPIKINEKGAFAEIWCLIDWCYDQPDYIPTPTVNNLIHKDDAA